MTPQGPIFLEEGGKMSGLFGISFPFAILLRTPCFHEKFIDDKGLFHPDASGILIAILQYWSDERVEMSHPARGRQQEFRT